MKNNIICIIVAGGTLLLPPGPAIARDDGLARGYALAFAAAYEAKRNCPGLTVNLTALETLRAAAHLTDSEEDDAFLRQRFDVVKPELEGGLVKNGAKVWCEGAWNLFGPKGLQSIRREINGE